ncbi:MAG: LysM peptidoglycan-binding domain-containing protein [Pikeienuella sp.]
MRIPTVAHAVTIAHPTKAALAGVALALGLAGAPAPAEAAGCPPRIVVHPGDTLSGIAAACRTTVRALLIANPKITHPSRIFAGEVIRVPPPGPYRTAYRPRPAYKAHRAAHAHRYYRIYGPPPYVAGRRHGYRAGYRAGIHY